MCGIAGIVATTPRASPVTARELEVMGDLLAHRGPDGEGYWLCERARAGFAHRRLAIMDLSDAGSQPMIGPDGSVLVFNGEIYNYRELMTELARDWTFVSECDSEVILAAYARWGTDCVDRLRGMFAFAIWDAGRRRLFAARDRFGIKPFYYAEAGGRFVFGSEIKALIPFLDRVETDPQALAQYLTFQFPIGGRTMFADVRQIAPGEVLVIENGGTPTTRRYWDVYFEPDERSSPDELHERLRALLDDSVRAHLQADVPVGSYLSGGIDSSLIAILASRHDPRNIDAFHGKFVDFPGYDESDYARVAASSAGKRLHEVEIGARDFTDNIGRVVYHLDHPTAGPGSFPQYMVSRLAADHVKVVLGGQGGDELFAGYARYLIAYFEQCLKAAIEGHYKPGPFVVTAESIIPNLVALREYRPLMRQFWAEGLFEDLDRRYLRLIDRSADFAGEVRADARMRGPIEDEFTAIINDETHVAGRAYLDRMTHFDFRTLLPALLQVEDRMSMAHGLESRVPFLDHSLVEFLATVPAIVKFRDGRLKTMLKEAYADVLPPRVHQRTDKMGFPVPLSEWLSGDLRDFVQDVFASEAARSRDLYDIGKVRDAVDTSTRFSRKLWGLLNLELWQTTFHDRAAAFRSMLDAPAGERAAGLLRAGSPRGALAGSAER